MKKLFIILLLLWAGVAYGASTTLSGTGSTGLSGTGSTGFASGGACSSNLSSEQGSTLETTGGGNSDGEMFYVKLVASATGYANTMIMQTQYGGEGEYVWMAIYDSSGDLIAETSDTLTSDSKADTSATLDSTVCIESGSTYYLGFECSAETVIYYWRNVAVGNNVWKVTNTQSNGPPSTINSATDGTEFTDTTINLRIDYQ